MARKIEAHPEEGEILDLTHDGRGITRLGGKAVFIEGALPGERVRFHVVKRRASHDEARLDAIIHPSPDRVEPRCRHFGVCGGCSLQHLAARAQISIKQSQLVETLARVGRVEPKELLPALEGPVWSYRRRARIGVKFVKKKGRVLAGFREREMPYIADISRCEILRAPFENLPSELAALVGSMELREHIPQVEFSAGDTDCALVFRTMRTAGDSDRDRLRQFGEAHRVQIYLQPGGLDSIQRLEEAPELPPEHPGEHSPERPPAHLSYGLSEFGLTMGFEPVSFVQVNGTVNEAMVHRAVEQLALGPQDRVLDLFCGLGNFTLALARSVARVTGVEGDAQLIAGARRNAAVNGITNADFQIADLFQPKVSGGWADASYDAILIDPPRAGAREVVEQMSRWEARRVVYISCHPGSLARDAGILVHTQDFELIAAGVMDMFPHTTHIESIAVFEKRV